MNQNQKHQSQTFKLPMTKSLNTVPKHDRSLPLRKTNKQRHKVNNPKPQQSQHPRNMKESLKNKIKELW